MSQEYWIDPKIDLAEFNNLAQAMIPRGEVVTQSPYSAVYYFEASNHKAYYIKQYTSAGKYLRRFIGRSRNRAESENLKYFAALGIATPPVVAYGEARRWGCFSHGVLITAALSETTDLVQLDQAYLQDTAWLQRVSFAIANYTRKLHQHGFIHNDLKWRNILVDKSAASDDVYFIDCPVGRKRYFYCRWRGIIKDLACLDKIAKQRISRTQRLRFYLAYAQKTRLNLQDKKKIKKIVNFFQGRD